MRSHRHRRGRSTHQHSSRLTCIQLMLTACPPVLSVARSEELRWEWLLAVWLRRSASAVGKDGGCSVMDWLRAVCDDHCGLCAVSLLQPERDLRISCCCAACWLRALSLVLQVQLTTLLTIFCKESESPQRTAAAATAAARVSSPLLPLLTLSRTRAAASAVPSRPSPSSHTDSCRQHVQCRSHHRC
jgi:hypothetical protein